jgi:hypothetical protein
MPGPSSLFPLLLLFVVAIQNETSKEEIVDLKTKLAAPPLPRWHL